jgi:nucleoside recognition membrane protein YjiH
MRQVMLIVKEKTGDRFMCHSLKSFSENMPRLLYFAIPSFLGLSFYIAPIYFAGTISTPIALVISGLKILLHDWLSTIITAIICISGIASLVFHLVPYKWHLKKNLWNNVLYPSLPVLLLRLTAGVLILLINFEAFPEILGSEVTGDIVLQKILPSVLLSFFVGCPLLPLILEFGLPEFCGTLLKRFMRPIFNLPGHSAINCLIAWIGSNCLGILITNHQFQDGLYTQREAAIIGTTFPIVSITYSLIIITQIGLVHLFLPFYLTILIAGFIVAVIVPRLPPLSGKLDIYISGDSVPPSIESKIDNHSSLSCALERAVQKTLAITSFRKLFIDRMQDSLALILTVLPFTAVVSFATLLLANHTPLFEYLGMPFRPLLTLLPIPEASRAADCMVSGFADMILPSILAAGIKSDLTRFFIAVMSVVQLIYLSETGVLLLSSEIPVGIKDLFLLFILRTIVAMPAVALITHLIF